MTDDDLSFGSVADTSQDSINLSECCGVSQSQSHDVSNAILDTSVDSIPNIADLKEFMKSNYDHDVVEENVGDSRRRMTNTQPFDIESMLKVPPKILFPLELSRHLKDKLIAVVEQNWHLIKNVQCQEQELQELRRIKDECQINFAAIKKESPTLLSTKVIVLSKKNREMTTQMERMNYKIQKCIKENEEMKKKLVNLEPADGSGDASNCNNTSRSDASDVTNVTQQLAKITGKLTESRRQNHLLQMELKTALRALSQEVGEGTTPKTVLKEVCNPESTWRGRQQQILTLTQKISELQAKLAHAQQQQSKVQLQTKQDSFEEEDEQQLEQLQPKGLLTYNIHLGSGDMIGGGGDMLKGSSAMSVISTARPHTTLQNIERKKQTNAEKVNQEIIDLRNQLKLTQLESKGSKARNQFLESQVRSLRVELDETCAKFRSKMESYQHSQEELKELRQELVVVREREKRQRESSLVELHEANQALAREKSVAIRLQKLIAEKQDLLQKLDSKVSRLQDDVQIYSSSSPSIAEQAEKIKTLENQLQLATQSISAAEKERERLLTLISNSVGEAQQERQGRSEAELALSRAFTILSLTDSCINRCLDAGQVTNKKVLEEVEEIRALVRELKAGITNYEVTKLYTVPLISSSPTPTPSSPGVRSVCSTTSDIRNSKPHEYTHPIDSKQNNRAKTVNTHRKLYIRGGKAN